jgi:MFS family permease
MVDTLDFEVSNGYVYEKVLKPQPSTDPNDPLVRISRDKKLIKNWSRFRKYLAIFNVGFFLFQVDFSSSSLTICLPKIQLEVPIPDNVRTAFASAPLLFLGLGCIFWNPVCMKIGKRPGLVAANALFVAASIWTANAASMQTLLASRLLQGFAASAAHGMGPSCISDVSFLHERASKLALYEYFSFPHY